jgi:hypothetical protein
LLARGFARVKERDIAQGLPASGEAGGSHNRGGIAGTAFLNRSIWGNGAIRFRAKRFGVRWRQPPLWNTWSKRRSCSLAERESRIARDGSQAEQGGESVRRRHSFFEGSSPRQARSERNRSAAKVSSKRNGNSISRSGAGD